MINRYSPNYLVLDFVHNWSFCWRPDQTTICCCYCEPRSPHHWGSTRPDSRREQVDTRHWSVRYLIAECLLNSTQVGRQKNDLSTVNAPRGACCTKYKRARSTVCASNKINQRSIVIKWVVGFLWIHTLQIFRMLCFHNNTQLCNANKLFSKNEKYL